MKTRIIALGWMLVLGLLTSVTFASEQPIENYEPSFPGGFNPEAGLLKSQNDCPADTAFFKNQFPGLTNGPGGSFAQLTYPIDGTDVTFQVFWAGDNSFRFEVFGGVAHIVGVTSDTNTLLYDYVNFYPAVNTPGVVNAPVSADGNLNKIANAADVNHLDFCLAVADPGDIEPPSVTIDAPDGTVPVSGTVTVLATVSDESGVVVTVSVDDGQTISEPMNCTLQSENPNVYACSYEWDTTNLGNGSYTISVDATDTPGNTATQTVTVSLDNEAPEVTIDSPENTTPPAQVSGEISVVATVTDVDSGVDQSSVTATVYQDNVVIEVLDLDPGNPPAMDVYTWLWGTEPLSSGLYTIEVSAADTLGNTTEPPASVTVEVVKLFSDCFGTLGAEDFAEDPSEPDTQLAGGCKPTPLVRLQTSQFTQNCAGDNPDYFCFLSGTLLKPHPDHATAHCGIYGFRDPRMIMIEGPSPLYPVGRWIPNERRPYHVFVESGIHPDLEAGVLAEVQAAYPDGFVAPTSLDDALVLDENTYCANGCCAFSQHVKGYETEVLGAPPAGTQLNVLYPEWPLNALAFIKVHFPLLVLDDEDLVAKCYDRGTNPDLQNTSGAGYQPLFQTADDSGFMTVLTQECVNPARTLTRNNGFDGSNIIVSTAEPYIDAGDAPVDVLTFMYQQNEDDFLRLFATLDVVERDGLVLTGNFRRDVRSPVNQAKRRFDNFNANSLQKSIDALKEAEDGIRTKTTYLVTEANAPGEALSLISHLIWDLGLLKMELERVEALP